MRLERMAAWATGAGPGIRRSTALRLAERGCAVLFDDLVEQDAPVLGRVYEPEDLRDAILGILEGSDMVSGRVLVVDGGLGIAG